MLSDLTIGQVNSLSTTFISANKNLITGRKEEVYDIIPVTFKKWPTIFVFYGCNV